MLLCLSVKNSLNAAGRFVVKLARLVFALFVALLVVFLLLISAELLLRAAYESLPSHPDPASDYAAAVNRFRELQKMEGSDLNPVCRSILLTHGIRTERAVVFFHGLTNCPQQFRELGQIFFDMGTMC